MTMSQTIKKRLQTIQTTALQICCGAFKTTSAVALQVECGELPMDLGKRDRRALLYAAKVKALKHHPNAEIFEDHWTKHYGKFTGQNITENSKRNKKN